MKLTIEKHWSGRSKGDWRSTEGKHNNNENRPQQLNAVLLNHPGHSKYHLDNKIGDDGAKAIGDALKANASLTELDLKLLCIT